jgi:hypothetical protein
VPVIANKPDPIRQRWFLTPPQQQSTWVTFDCDTVTAAQQLQFMEELAKISDFRKVVPMLHRVWLVGWYHRTKCVRASEEIPRAG